MYESVAIVSIVLSLISIGITVEMKVREAKIKKRVMELEIRSSRH